VTERQVIEQGRQPALKLGLALQIGFLRMSGRILEDPTFIQHELDRRLAAARAADPTKKREQGLKKEIIRVGKSVERILSAYQEGLVSLDQLRERMPPLRQREQALREEARAIADQSNDSAMFLRLAAGCGALQEASPRTDRPRARR
jgi:site-specific DNA recombinase